MPSASVNRSNITTPQYTHHSDVSPGAATKFHDQNKSHTVIIIGSVLERKKSKRYRKHSQSFQASDSFLVLFNQPSLESTLPTSLNSPLNQDCKGYSNSSNLSSNLILKKVSHSNSTKRQNIMTVQISEGAKQQLQNIDKPDTSSSLLETSDPSIIFTTPTEISSEEMTRAFDTLNIESPGFKSQTSRASPTPRRGSIIKLYQYEFKFREDLLLVQKLFMKRLKDSKMFPPNFIDEVLSTLFYKITEFIDISNEVIKLLDNKLSIENQNRNATIGDVLLNCAQSFESYIDYSLHYPSAKSFLAKQCQANIKFRLWIENCQRQSTFKKYGLIGFLKSIKFHLVSYPKYLTEILNNTPKDHPDSMLIPDAIDEIESILKEIHDSMSMSDTKLSTTSDPGLSEGEHDSRSSSSSVNTSPNSTQLSFTQTETVEASQPEIQSPPQQNQLNLPAPNRSGFRRSVQAPVLSWSDMVSSDTLSKLSADEIKRQETIYELVQSERAFAKDLDIITTLFIDPLRNEDVFEPKFRDAAIHKLFFNYLDISKLAQELATTLESLHAQNMVVDKIGDSLISWSQKLHPFDIYGSRVQFANDYFVTQKSENPKFMDFIKRCDSNPLANKLSMDSFISRPTTRLARYPLLLQSILKKTPPGHPDHVIVQQVITNIETHLSKINETKGNTDRKLRMVTILDRLEYKGGSVADLHLETPNRTLVKEGMLKLHNSFNARVFLFDHLLLITRERQLAGDLVEYEVYKRPLFLSEIALSEEVITSGGYGSLGIFDSIIGKDTSKVNEDLMFSIVHKETMDTFILSTISLFDRQHWIDAILNEADKFN